MASVARRQYEPRRLDALVAFSEANRPSPYLVLPARRLLTELAPPEGVVELTVGGKTALVAAVVDRCENLYNAAMLEILAWNDEVPLEPLLAEAVPIATEVARAAGRAHVTLALPERRAPGGPSLAALGWTPAEGSYILERDTSRWPTPPARGAWSDLVAAGVVEHYTATRAAFAEDPGTLVPDFSTFRAACLSAELPVRVLREGGREVGFARVTLEEGGRLGYIASIGRIPDVRGEGFGPVILAEALRVLAARGVARYRLGVTASNAAAVALYQRWGFREVERWRTWRRPVEGR